MLGFLHILINVRFRVTVPFVVIVLAFILVFLLHLLTPESLEEVHHLLIVQRIGEVLGETCETAELSLSPIGDVLTLARGSTHTISLIDIRFEDCTQIQGITLG